MASHATDVDSQGRNLGDPSNDPHSAAVGGVAASSCTARALRLALRSIRSVANELDVQRSIVDIRTFADLVMENPINAFELAPGAQKLTPRVEALSAAQLRSPTRARLLPKRVSVACRSGAKGPAPTDTSRKRGV
jgi:hypothetical protein